MENINDSILQDSRAMKYPDVLSSKDNFQSEDVSLWDKAMFMADHMIERGYPIGHGMDKYALAEAIYNKQLKDLTPKEVEVKWEI